MQKKSPAPTRQPNEASSPTADIFRKILESSTEYAVAVTDMDFRITHYNQAAQRIFGLSAQEVIGRTVHEVHLRENVSAEQFQRAVDAVRRDGKWEYEIERGLEGDRKTVQSTVTLMHDEAGHPVGYVLFGRDITQLRRQENRIRLISRAVEQSPASVMITDVKGNIEYVNPKFERVTGYTAEEVIGQNPRLLKSGFQPPEFYKELWDTVTADKEWYGEFCNKKKNGEFYWELASISPVRNEKGEVTNFVAVKENITRQKRLEEQLRRLSSSLSLAEERERRRLAADLHDRVGQTLAVCKMKLGAARAATRSQELSAMLQEVTELVQATIRETRTMTFELCPPVLYELGLVAAIQWLGDQMESCHDLTVRVEDDGQPKPLSDDLRSTLFRAVSELLTNVVKHAHAKNTVVSIQRAGDRIHLEVVDDGAGVDVSGGIPSSDEGGFGLFSIRQRLEVLDGTMSIDAERGCGVRVTLTAPISDPPGDAG